MTLLAVGLLVSTPLLVIYCWLRASYLLEQERLRDEQALRHLESFLY